MTENTETPQLCCTKFKDYTISTARDIFHKQLFETIVLKGSNRVFYAKFGNELDAIHYHMRQLGELYSLEVDEGL